MDDIEERLVDLERQSDKALKDGGGSSTILFIMGGLGVLGIIGAPDNFDTGFGAAATIGILGWAFYQLDKEKSANRRYREIRDEIRRIKERGAKSEHDHFL